MTERVDANFMPLRVGGGDDGGQSGEVTGVYKGETVKAKDANELFEDSLEELTFAASENVEKKLSERKVVKKEDIRPNVTAMERAEYFIRKLPDMGRPEKLLRFMESLKAEKRPTSRALKEKAREFYQDVSHQFAALSFARETLEEEGGRPDLVDALAQATDEMEAESGPEIRAGLNVSEDALLFEKGGFSNTGELRQFYRDTVLPGEGLSSAFSTIMDKWGEDGFQNAVAFLLKAVGSDISSQGPSVDPLRLKSSMDDIYNLEVLGNLLGRCGELLARMNREFGTGNSLSPRELLGALLELKDRAVPDPALAEKLADRAGAVDLEARIYFLRELKDLARQLPIKIFDGLEMRERMLDTVQEALDAAIEAEEDAME